MCPSRQGARLLPATSNPDRNPTEDHEEAGGGVFRQWDFSQSVPDREAGLRGRPTGASFNYASLYTSSLAAGATPMEHPPTTRPELFGDRSAPRALAPGAVLGGSKEEVDPAARTKESKMK